jgi:hypothetical protein
VIDAVVEFVSGEKLFDWLKKPNGGTIIFLRSVWVSVIIYAVALLLHTGSYAEWTWEFWKWPCHIDFRQLKKDIADTVTWLGAIFAGVYVALYARFAAQWSYLAGEYNQIRQTLVTTKEPDPDHLLLWRAAFIEDALDLHLATKPMFARYLKRMLHDYPEIANKFDSFAVDGPKRRRWLEKQLEKIHP